MRDVLSQLAYLSLATRTAAMVVVSSLCGGGAAAQ